MTESLSRIRGTPILLIGGIFLLFLGDSLFQIALPTVLVTEGGLSATVAGLMLSLGLSIGIFLVAPISQFSDQTQRSRSLLWCTVPIAAAGLMLAIAAHMKFELWIWLVPILVFGLMRTPLTVVWLAFITERGDKMRMQAANGIAQRSAVAVAAVVVAFSNVGVGSSSQFVTIALVLAAVLFVGFSLFRAEREQPVKSAVRRASPYRRSFQVLRTRRLRASSALNAAIGLTTILGNAFYPLGLVGKPSAYIATWVLVFLVTRDLAGAVVAGVAFKRIIAKIGIAGSLGMTAISLISGLLLLSIPGYLPIVVIPSALLQGVACATAIGCTNLLAAYEGGTDERATRIGATQYLPAIILLIAPAPLGMVLDLSNISMVFLSGSALCAGLLFYVMYQISPRRNAESASTSV